jgi:SAM-dependent methyltransferase
MAIPPAACEPGHRYRSVAAHYLAGRPAYADLLIRRVAALVGLRRQDAVLDLGCGPGVLARAFAPLVREVVAMDPEPEMLREATEACAGIGNIRFVAGGSDDLAPALGRFRMVAMGRSFHWMDRAPTLRRLDGLVEQDGAVVLFHTHHAAVPANAWAETFGELRRRYGDDRPGPNGAAGTGWVRHEAFLLASPFCRVETHAVFQEGRVDTARLIQRAFSMGGTSPERLGDCAADLERDIGALVREMAPDGHLAEVIESSALIARRPDAQAAA